MIRRFVPPGSTTAVVLGVGASELAFDELERVGAKRALVLSTPGRRADAVRIADGLGARAAGVLAIAEEHVPIAVAEQARREARLAGADALVPTGGGSTIGLAKAIALTHPACIVAIPTTYSGSEMTPIFGITEAGAKRTGRDSRVQAKCVLYDPLLSQRLPPRVAVPSAFNALAHAVEALYAPEADAVLRDTATDAVRLLVASLPELSAGTPDLGARETALHGACLAGACLGRTSMGLHHKLCHVLGGSFGLPHAETHAVLLPHVARFNLAAAPPAREALSRALGGAEPDAALERLVAASGVPRGLAALGFRREDIAQAAELATGAPYPNPRPVTTAAVAELLEAALGA